MNPYTREQGEAKLLAKGNTLPFVLVTALFFLWGIPHNLNDVLIKQFMKSFEMSPFRAGLIQSAFYMGYFMFSMPAALIMKKYSYKTGLVIGLLLYSAGTLLFWPAAITRQYGFFLFALFVIASGLGFLETGANPFVAMLGDPRTSERRLNFSQAFNPFGAIAGVLIGFGVAAAVNHFGPTLSSTTTGAAVGASSVASVFHQSSTVSAIQSIHLQTVITWQTVLLGVAFALVGGLLAGIVGGWRASRLAPATALRHLG